MKIAVLADIHSNVYALDAVIADGQWRGMDSMVNPGSVGLPAYTDERTGPTTLSMGRGYDG